MVLSQLVSAIDADRQEGTNLSSAIRLFVFDHLSSGAVGPIGEPMPLSHAQGNGESSLERAQLVQRTDAARRTQASH
jgi:predicted DNA-binding ribbon-helix-helix protein